MYLNFSSFISWYAIQRLIETIGVFECKSCGFKSILEWWLIETIVVFEFFTASGKSFLLQD